MFSLEIKYKILVALISMPSKNPNAFLQSRHAHQGLVPSLRGRIAAEAIQPEIKILDCFGTLRAPRNDILSYLQQRKPQCLA